MSSNGRGSKSKTEARQSKTKHIKQLKERLTPGLLLIRWKLTATISKVFASSIRHLVGRVKTKTLKSCQFGHRAFPCLTGILEKQPSHEKTAK
jgi:hypothetical protein